MNDGRTHLLNFMTPHVHPGIHSLFFFFHCTARRRDVEASCTPVTERDSQQHTNRVDSSMQRSQSSNADKTVLPSTERLAASKRVQKTQPSVDDKTVLLGTETAVALKHEESEVPTLISQTARRSQRGTEGKKFFITVVKNLTCHRFIYS